MKTLDADRPPARGTHLALACQAREAWKLQRQLDLQRTIFVGCQGPGGGFKTVFVDPVFVAPRGGIKRWRGRVEVVGSPMACADFSDDSDLPETPGGPQLAFSEVLVEMRAGPLRVAGDRESITRARVCVCVCRTGERRQNTPRRQSRAVPPFAAPPEVHDRLARLFEGLAAAGKKRRQPLTVVGGYTDSSVAFRFGLGPLEPEFWDALLGLAADACAGVAGGWDVWVAIDDAAARFGSGSAQPFFSCIK